MKPVRSPLFLVFLLVAAGVSAQPLVISPQPLPVPDTQALIRGSADVTKRVRIEVDGLTTATTRVWTAPDANFTVAGINLAQTWSASQSFATGLALRTDTGAGNTLLLQAYDTDTGPAYVTLATLTAGTAPAWTIDKLTSLTFLNGTVLLDTANTLIQRNGTNAQTFDLSETWTDASNNEHYTLAAGSNALTISAVTAGTGADNLGFTFVPAGTSGMILDGPLAIGVTTTPGLTLRNTTAAAAGAQQYSPGFSQIGQGWKTDATAASQPVEVRWELRPVQGAAAPTFSYALMGRVNNGAWTDLMTFASSGRVNVITTGLDFAEGGNVRETNRGYLDFPAAGVFQFRDEDDTSGIRIQFAAAPTIASGFGTTPTILTGSTDTAGGVDVGTGGVATSGVVAFATTWASAPFCTVMDRDSLIVQRATTSTTQLTITSNAAWTASDDVVWTCIGSK